MTKSFLLFLALFAALGTSIGGSFAGGVAFGRSQDNEPSTSAPNLASSGNFGQQLPGGAAQGFSAGDSRPEDLARLRQRVQSGDFSPEELAQLRQRFQSGDVNPEALAQLRQRFQSGDVNPEALAQLRDRFGSEDASPEELTQLRQRFGGRFGLGARQGFGESVTGTIDAVDGNQVTLETAEGPKIVIIGQETVIQKSTTGTLDDLQQGVRVAVFGSPEDEEGAEARFVVLIPEGAGGPFGGGSFFGERRFRRDGGSP